MQSTAKCDLVLEYYARPGGLTAASRYAEQLERLPRDIAGLCRVAQGLVLHRYMAPAYGVTIGAERAGEDHIRSVEAMLDQLLVLDPRALSEARPPEARLVGVCRHFAILLAAMLRAQGVPARVRVGTGAYFNPGYYEDHWVCEYWRAEDGRWALADPQFDAVWLKNLRIEHDVLDIPRDQFLIAGEAWALCRTGRADAEKFGIFEGNLRGLWFIADELVRDAAALNKVEMLAWDVWGAMLLPGAALTQEQLAFFDRLAALTRDPDASFDELRECYEGDERLRVPKTVFNALLNRPESV